MLEKIARALATLTIWVAGAIACYAAIVVAVLILRVVMRIIVTL
jgi:hypothetical protein